MPTTEALSQINYWAVVVSALATFSLAALWYSPVLFEGAWTTANGFTEEQLELVRAKARPTTFVVTLLAYLVMATVFALLMAWLDAGGLASGLAVGFLLWLGFVGCSGLTATLFSPRPLSAWLIDAGFQLTFLLVTGAILALWR